MSAHDVLSALRAQAQALSASIEALAQSLETTQDDLLDLPACKARGVGRDALTAAANRGEIAVSRGPRGKLLVRRTELDRWLASKPYIPKERDPAPDLAAWERRVRRAG